MANDGHFPALKTGLCCAQAYPLRTLTGVYSTSPALVTTLTVEFSTTEPTQVQGQIGNISSVAARTVEEVLIAAKVPGVKTGSVNVKSSSVSWLSFVPEGAGTISPSYDAIKVHPRTRRCAKNTGGGGGGGGDRGSTQVLQA